MLDILTYNYELYERDPNRNLSDQEVVNLHALHFQTETDNADVWRQHRLMEPVLETMSFTKAKKWLTIGDGAYGLESIRMRRKGFTDVLPTDIDGKLLQTAKDAGHITEYRVENAEKLSFMDNSFDYVLCKDSYHHLPRPVIGLYEMLRVARHAVVLIEPQDPWADYPLMAGPSVSGYESVGNYVYTISRRELEKVALGLDLPAIAFKSVYDYCPPQIEKIKVSPSDPDFNAYLRTLFAGEDACRENKQKHNMLFAVLFKTKPDQAFIDSIASNPNGWNMSFFQGNPHKKKYEETI